MRRILLPLVSIMCLLTALQAHGQSPPGINYQGIARNPDGKPLGQKDIAIRINILENGGNGDVEYAEVHTVKTNSFGLFTLVIGNGSAETGEFPSIDWSVGNKWLRVEMDPDGGSSFQLMGSQQFMSVPYAFYAKYSGSGLTAGQGISISDNTIRNTGDADANAANELNTSFQLGSDHVLRLTDAAGTKEVDLNAIMSPGSVPQDLQLTGDILKITENASATDIDLAPYKDNTDEQELSISSDQLSITGGNSVNLLPYKDNTDEQQLSISSDQLSITGGNSVNLLPYKDNTDEQQLSISSDQLSITGGNSVNLLPYKDNTDQQNLSLSGTNLSISGGTGVSLSALRQDLSSTSSGNDRTISITNGSSTTINVADADASTTNEIQDLSRTGNLLSLSGDPTPATIDLGIYLDDTDDQTLSFSATPSPSLTIAGGNSVNLSALLDNTDNQELSLNTLTNRLSISGGMAAPVNLTPYLDNTDFQNLSLSTSGNNRTISIDNGTGVAFSVADGDADPTNELQSLTYNAVSKSLSISGGNAVTVTETQNLNQVLAQGGDANGQRITNLGAPTANTDATTKQYVDNADAAINARISANYAFKANFTFSALLAGSNITLPLSEGTGAFDDFNVVNTANFTAAVAGTYVFTVDGDISSILLGSAINLLYNGTKYPVSVGSNNRYNTTLMFRLTAGQTVSLVADGLGLGTNINGTFFGYKLP